MFTTEIIAAGDELLTGVILDTNTHWLCRRITALGGRVVRAAIVRDSVAMIATELSGALARQTDLILTTGGLGPTADDLTLAAVAQATGRPLECHPEALDFVSRKFEDLARQGFVDHALTTPAREKMATLPATASVLGNPRGVAPAILLHSQTSRIVCLPGVPSELQSIYDDLLVPVLTSAFPVGAHLRVDVIVETGDESLIAPILSAVANEIPNVYLKSLAESFGPDVRIRVLLSASDRSLEAARELIDRTLRRLRAALVEAGLEIARIDD